MLGERLTQLVSFEELKLAAGAVILSPFIPLLFMGEEYGEEAPFQYFISHTDPGLVRAVRGGRRREFAAFGWREEPPDPQDEATFLRAKLNHPLRRDDKHRTLWEFYRELIDLRKTLAPLARLSKAHCEVTGFDGEKVLLLRRWSGADQVVSAFNFNAAQVSVSWPLPAGRWRKALDSTESRWQGGGSSLAPELAARGATELSLPPRSIVVFAGEGVGQAG
jgi:maltooligosyltrehalose trehalohydrolase